MALQRPFRFGAFAIDTSSRSEWVDQALRVESQGYSTLVMGEHISWGGLAPLLALSVAAEATTSLRVGTHALTNDLRHPALLAQEATTLDLLSGGRLELGLGAGWMRADYDTIGLPFDPPGVRVSRLEEAVHLIKRLFRDESVSFSGDHCKVEDLSLDPKPVQLPHPPIFLSGGGRRMLSVAAREANIVGIDPVSTPAGKKDIATTTAQAIDRQISWVREAAGDRLEEIELHNSVWNVVVTEDRQRGAEEVARWLGEVPDTIFSNLYSDTEQILQSPYFLIGTVDHIVEELQARRERFGISYITVFPGLADTFSPVVARLADR